MAPGTKDLRPSPLPETGGRKRVKNADETKELRPTRKGGNWRKPGTPEKAVPPGNHAFRCVDYNSGMFMNKHKGSKIRGGQMEKEKERKDGHGKNHQ